MLSTRFITILAFIVTATALPAFRKPVFKQPVTSLKRAELEDTSPWIKFPHFGNVLKSFPNFLPTIPEAGPKIENDGQKFQVIVNVKEYDKDYLKVVVMGSFIHIQGAHEDVQDRRGSIDSQFIQTYTLPTKSSASSVTAVLTSDDYLVVTAPISSIINKVSYKEKEIPIILTEEPLLKPEIDEIKDSSSTSSPESLIQAIPPTVLLPPKPINDVIINVEPFIPNALTTELLPPKINYDEATSAPIVSPVLLNYENHISSENKVDKSPIVTSTATNIEKTRDEFAIVPTLISIPLQQQNKDEQFLIAPTYTPINPSISVTDDEFISEINVIQNSISNQVNIEEKVNIPSTQSTAKLSESQNINEFQLEEVIPVTSSDLNENSSNVNIKHGLDNIQSTEELRSLFMEPMQGHIMINHIDEDIITTEKPLVNLYSDDDTYTSTSTSMQEQTTIAKEIMEKENIQDFATEMFLYQEVKTSEKTIPPVLRSEIFQESDNFTEEPETETFDGNSNSKNTDSFLSEMLFESTTDDVENIIATTIYSRPSVEDESEKNVESSTLSQVVIEENRFKENKNITLESKDENVFIATENLFEEQKNEEQLKESTSGESLIDVAKVSYNEDVGANPPQSEVSTEQITYYENDVNKTSEVNEF